MGRAQEYRFQIDAYTPQTMPLGRLAAYLQQLAILLGEEKSVHLLRLEPGSTVLVHRVDAEAVARVDERMDAVRRGEGPPEAMRAYKGLNRLLREDDGIGMLKKTGEEIIRFPGREHRQPDFVSVPQAGELDGEVVRVGGLADWVPITLRIGGESVTRIHAKRSLAKSLAGHLFEPVRLYGTGRWTRSVDGEWQLERFCVDRFEVLDDRPLSSLVLELRALLDDEWEDDALDELIALRRGEEPAS